MVVEARKKAGTISGPKAGLREAWPTIEDSRMKIQALANVPNGMKRPSTARNLGENGKNGSMKPYKSIKIISMALRTNLEQTW